MVIDHPTRREALALLGAALLPGLATARDHPPRAGLVATWAVENRYEVGLLSRPSPNTDTPHRLALPSRAHGVWTEPQGTVLVAARRPGDWLLRWHPTTGQADWHWIDDDRQLNGHVMRSPDGQGIWTTETDQADASGLIGVRTPTTLAKQDEWPTHGMDPHAMLVLPQAMGAVPAGSLLVANGGIPTQSETGRSHRDIARMDPSLVALDPGSGQLLGQWRLDDARLSIRHLAFDAVHRRVGIALQAEHDDEAHRRDAPLLATWDGERLRAAPPVVGGMGYGGDICARPGGGFLVSATRADQVLCFDAAGHLMERLALAGAGALASQRASWWAAGARTLLAGMPRAIKPWPMRVDNHWQLFGDG